MNNHRPLMPSFQTLAAATLLGASLVVAGCQGPAAPARQVAPPAPKPAAASTGSSTVQKQAGSAEGAPCEDGMDCAPAETVAQAQPVPAQRRAPSAPPTVPVAPVPAPPKTVMSERDVLKQLERTPGSTPALAQVSVKPGPKHSSLEGKPGPSPGFGPDDAPVKVFIFSDFQCPVCRRVVEPVKKLARDYGDKVQIVFLQNALKMHRQAEIAAAASMAAFKQGKFWEYHDALFSNRRGLARETLIEVATALKLDIKQFTSDLDDPTIRQQIAYERSLAQALGATGTPGFFVNGQKLVGWGSYIGFKSMVDRALRATKGVPAGTPKSKVAGKATAAAGEDGKRFAELYWGLK